MSIHPFVYYIFFDERDVDPIAAIELIMEFCK